MLTLPGPNAILVEVTERLCILVCVCVCGVCVCGQPQYLYLIMRDWNCAMEYEPEFCMATWVAMENFHPLQKRKREEREEEGTRGEEEMWKSRHCTGVASQRKCMRGRLGHKY